MIKYLKQIARKILKDELDAELIKLKESQAFAEALSSDKEKLQEKNKKMERYIKLMTDTETILLAHYRIDNAGENGLPPSYLDPNDPNGYTQTIGEIESVYRNPAFRKLIAYALNVHANISVTGFIKNEQGDEITISSEKANGMIKGIRAIWELVVGGHKRDLAMRRDKNFDKHALMELDEDDNS